MERRRRLEGLRGPQHRGLAEVRAYELQADGQPPGKAAGHGDGGHSCQIDGHGEDIGHVERERIVDALADLEGRNGHGGAGQKIHVLEGAQEVLFDQRSHLQGFEVVAAVVAG